MEPAQLRAALSWFTIRLPVPVLVVMMPPAFAAVPEVVPSVKRPSTCCVLPFRSSVPPTPMAMKLFAWMVLVPPLSFRVPWLMTVWPDIELTPVLRPGIAEVGVVSVRVPAPALMKPTLPLAVPLPPLMRLVMVVLPTAQILKGDAVLIWDRMPPLIPVLPVFARIPPLARLRVWNGVTVT